jgi:DNA-binding PadR family transcriptional regulator
MIGGVPSADETTEAVTGTPVEHARAAVGADVRAPAGAGSQDPLVGDLRRGGLLPLLVLHFTAQEPCYGNQLIERIAELTTGALTVNPNTMYPLLRQLEARGFVHGEWEHPERRSRRFYRITDAGREECSRLRGEVGPRLERIARSIHAIREELGR